eukprot:TRINITY_DN2704_c0_g1_i2.p1 TRINITY_DN2704_c0_g1~~TRINITY_DN2704_c0_g1_i2.p1  ORF type:complete len:285 (+),score=82.76 TRINITY_DN2704_c0_g1_i2:47-901(+)
MIGDSEPTIVLPDIFTELFDNIVFEDNFEHLKTNDVEKFEEILTVEVFERKMELLKQFYGLDDSSNLVDPLITVKVNLLVSILLYCTDNKLNIHETFAIFNFLELYLEILIQKDDQSDFEEETMILNKLATKLKSLLAPSSNNVDPNTYFLTEKTAKKFVDFFMYAIFSQHELTINAINCKPHFHFKRKKLYFDVPLAPLPLNDGKKIPLPLTFTNGTVDEQTAQVLEFALNGMLTEYENKLLESLQEVKEQFNERFEKLTDVAKTLKEGGVVKRPSSKGKKRR